jgi:N-acetylneuraminic acid mutarotase
MKTKSLKMKKAGSLLSTLMIVSLMFFYSCNSSDTVINGNWTRAADFGGPTREGAYQFTIGEITYVGLGYGGKNTNQYLPDSYSFRLTGEPDSVGFWNKNIAKFPGTPRELSVSFSIGQKGYVGTGFNRYVKYDSLQQLSDFWEYDPALNKWTQLADFPGAARYGAVAFATATNGYVGSGYDGNYYDDFYKYDPTTNTWAQIVTPSNPKRWGAMTMTINNKVYYFGGTSNGLANTDFFSFDPTTDTWTNATKISTDANFVDFTTAVKRSFASTVTMTINGLEYGYVICGTNGGTLTIVYQYDPSQDLWTKMTSFEGGARSQAISFVLDNRAFVGTGLNGSGKLDDVWEWKPTQTYDANN